MSKLAALTSALAEVEKSVMGVPISPQQQSEIEEEDDRARFAEEEINRGFPALHAHTVIAHWGALEVLVADLATVCLLNEPEILSGDQFAKLKIPLAEYERLGKEERMSFLVKEFSRSLNADFKLGIAKFEVILEPLGLAGSVKEDVRRALLEMSQVRNVLVHRAGIVDRRFKETCPWIDVEVGSKLCIDHKSYIRYFRATHEYVMCLINRARTHFGIEPYSEEEQNDPEGSA